MFFYLSKTIYFLFMPLGLITICLIGYLFLKNKKWKKIAGRLTLILLIIFTNPFFSSEVIRLWEKPPVEFSELKSKYDLAIVLTGVSNNTREPKDRVYFNKGADRVTHTVQLYKAGRIQKIMIAGGSGSFIKPEYSEAENLRKAFVLMGVNIEDILVETMSRNTHQSAINVKDQVGLLESKAVILVTSAFHMRRAHACFEKVGYQLDAFPVDFNSSTRRFTPDAWIPSPGALQKWTIVFHEILGIVAYKVMGYV